MRAFLCLLAGALALLEPSGAAEPVYLHHEHRLWAWGVGADRDVRSLAVDGRGRVWAATRSGFWCRASEGEAGFVRVAGPSAGPAFVVAIDSRGEAWGGAWDGLHRLSLSGASGRPEPSNPVCAIGTHPDGRLLVGGPDGYFELGQGTVTSRPIPATRYLHSIGSGPDGAWYLVTGMGVFRMGEGSAGYLDFPEDRVSRATRGVAWISDRECLVAALGGLQRYKDGRFVGSERAADGLPSDDVRVVRVAGDGVTWVGTASGVAFRAGQAWRVRQGRRWLADDDVRDLAFGPDGTVWVATAEGISALRPRSLSLEEKARHFHAILEARHVRPPGIVEKCRLRVAGDPSTWEPTDDDNDGGYTALALAMESYRYAATGDPAALVAARRALAACELLRQVAGTNGFLARTVIPATWTEMHDPNEALSEADWAAERVGDPRHKRVPARWRRSSDGRWLWKGDTSSDEVTAHFYGYFVFHEHAAQGEDRRRVREQIVAIADHLLREGLVLRDLDGQPTRWGIWSPERLGHDPDWAMERGINSVEILSFLKLAHHVSGEARFEAAYRNLIDRHGYDRNVEEAPNLNPAWRTYIDLELLAFAYPALLSLEKEPRLVRVYRRSLARWHEAVRRDGNPFFTYVHASLAKSTTAARAAAQEFLVDTPLDLIRWSVPLTSREDLRPRRAPIVETWQTDRPLPPSEIGYSRTDQNPWLMHQGDGGETESDGVFWLLPYWMGRARGWLP